MTQGFGPGADRPLAIFQDSRSRPPWSPIVLPTRVRPFAEGSCGPGGVSESDIDCALARSSFCTATSSSTSFSPCTRIPERPCGGCAARRTGRLRPLRRSCEAGVRQSCPTWHGLYRRWLNERRTPRSSALARMTQGFGPGASADRPPLRCARLLRSQPPWLPRCAAHPHAPCCRG